MVKRKPTVGFEVGLTQSRQKVPRITGLCLYDSPLSLKNMAAIQVTIAVWYHQNLKGGYDPESGDEGDCSDHDEASYQGNSSEEEVDPWEHKRAYQSYYDCYSEEHENDFCWEKVERQMTKDVGKLLVSSAVHKLVKQFVEPIKKNFVKWVTYHRKRVFFFSHQNGVYTLVDEVIWKSNGEVDFERTARNLLSSPRISDIEKFRLMCTYCMEDEIRNVSPRLLSNKYTENVDFNGYPLIYFWNCYAKNKLLKVPRGNYSSIDSRMISSKHVDNKGALQYFWNRLSENEKLINAKLLIRNFGVKHQNFLLSNLSDVDQQLLLVEAGPDIIINYTKKSRCDHAMQIWNHINDLSNPIELAKVILTLLDFACSNYSDSPKKDCTYVISLVRKMWINTSPQVKSLALDYEEKKFIKLLLKGNSRGRTKYEAMSGLPGGERTDSEEKFKLFCEMLKDANASLREEVIQSHTWRSHHEYLTTTGKTKLLDHFVKVCLPKDDLKARKDMMNTDESRNRCLNFLKEGKIEELNKYLSSYLSDARSIADYKVELVMSDKGIATFAESFNINTYKSLHTTIHKILIQKDAATEFKHKMIILTPSVCQQFHSWVEQGRWKKVNDCLELFMPDENETEMVKQTLLRSYQGEQMSKVFAHCNEAQWRDFLLWCLGDAQRVLQFKESIPFNAIFTILLQQSVFTRYDSKLNNCKFRSTCDFTEIDRFLRWFFVNSENVKKFKVSQVLEFRNIEVVNTLSRKKDDGYIKAVLNWFFEGDNTVIKLFKTKYKRFKISSLI